MYEVIERVAAPSAAVPDGMRVPFGWHAAPVVADEREMTELRWTGVCVGDVGVRFRVTVAIDVRDERLVDVVLLGSGHVVGQFDVRFAHVFQIFELVLTGEQARSAVADGLGLRLATGSDPLWIFVPDDAAGLVEPVLLPHLMFGDRDRVDTCERWRRFRQRMSSMASVQQFGWMEGCVLDGLLELEDATWARRQLDLFVDGGGGLVYEDSRSRPADGRFYGIEALLPVAALARLDPAHPVLDQAVEFVASRVDEKGVVCDGGWVTAEGSYTISYPLAVIARQRSDNALAALAFDQLVVRRDRLWHQDGLHLRCAADGTRSFRNWGRAYAWHLLGLVRSLVELEGTGLWTPDQRDMVEMEFVRTLRCAMSYRSGRGSWSCFIDAPGTGADMSATAGIAAAAELARSSRMGHHVRDIAPAVVAESLASALTPDGLLTQGAPVNRDGERFQRSGYRIMSQMAMGLAAQFLARGKG